MSATSQQMWRYLEPLFIQSDEVKKELPLDTKRFEKIDGEVKATLAELWKVKKVRAAAAHHTAPLVPLHL